MTASRSARAQWRHVSPPALPPARAAKSALVPPPTAASSWPPAQPATHQSPWSAQKSARSARSVCRCTTQLLVACRWCAARRAAALRHRRRLAQVCAAEADDVFGIDQWIKYSTSLISLGLMVSRDAWLQRLQLYSQVCVQESALRGRVSAVGNCVLVHTNVLFLRAFLNACARAGGAASSSVCCGRGLLAAMTARGQSECCPWEVDSAEQCCLEVDACGSCGGAAVTRDASGTLPALCSPSMHVM